MATNAIDCPRGDTDCPQVPANPPGVRRKSQIDFQEPEKNRKPSSSQFPVILRPRSQISWYFAPPYCKYAKLAWSDLWTTTRSELVERRTFQDIDYDKEGCRVTCERCELHRYMRNDLVLAEYEVDLSDLGIDPGVLTHGGQCLGCL